MPVNTERKPVNLALWKRRQKRQALLGAGFGCMMLLLSAAICAALCFIPNLPPWLLVLFAGTAILCLLPMGLTLVVLYQRFQEIEGGELDAAAEY